MEIKMKNLEFNNPFQVDDLHQIFYTLGCQVADTTDELIVKAIQEFAKNNGYSRYIIIDKNSLARYFTIIDKIYQIIQDCDNEKLTHYEAIKLIKEELK